MCGSNSDDWSRSRDSLQYEANCVHPDIQIGDRRSFILSSIGQLDKFISGPVEVVFAYIDPSIGNVVNVREDSLVDHNLI
jgi:hypothetical protein